MLYWRDCKDMQTSYFGYFGNPWLHTPKNDRLAHFILQNFKRIVRADPELLGCAIFGHKMAHLPWANFFWYKPILLLSSTCWPFSLCKIYKKLWGCRILGSKWSICPSFVHLLSLRKKITSQFRQNLQKDKRMDRRTDTSYFPAKDGGPKNLQSKIGLLVSIRGHVHLIIAVLGLWHPHLQLHEATLEKTKTE